MANRHSGAWSKLRSAALPLHKRILYGSATSGCEQPTTMSRSSAVDRRILVQKPVFDDRRDVAGGGRHR